MAKKKKRKYMIGCLCGLGTQTASQMAGPAVLAWFCDESDINK